jgi:two-component system, NtrC family, response regulator HydG
VHAPEGGRSPHPTMADDHSSTARYDVANLGFEAVKRYRVTVVAGEPTKKEFLVDDETPGQICLGSAPGCEVRLAGDGLSRRHARLLRTQEGLRIRDLESTNGTFLNNVRVVEAFVRPGDVIRLGSVVLATEEAGTVLRPVHSEASFGAVKGTSPAMRRIYPALERLSNSTVPFVLEGERGTGKATVATAVHELGPRADGPLVFWDCSSVKRAEQDETLFGTDRQEGGDPGVCEQAQGGTLVLEEVSALDPALQTRLLRLLERERFHRAGSAAWHRADIRLIALTNRSLGSEVDAGRLREDLFLRLATVRVELPPLREREGDVPFLVETLWTASGRAGPVPKDLLDRLAGHSWPGNVRELEVWVRRHAAIGDALQAAPSPRHAKLPPETSWIVPFLDLEGSFYDARKSLLDAFEGHYMARLLQKTNGNVSLAARVSGLPRRSLYVIKNRVSGRAIE